MNKEIYALRKLAKDDATLDDLNRYKRELTTVANYLESVAKDFKLSDSVKHKSYGADGRNGDRMMGAFGVLKGKL